MVVDVILKTGIFFHLWKTRKVSVEQWLNQNLILRYHLIKTERNKTFRVSLAKRMKFYNRAKYTYSPLSK